MKNILTSREKEDSLKKKWKKVQRFIFFDDRTMKYQASGTTQSQYFYRTLTMTPSTVIFLLQQETPIKGQDDLLFLSYNHNTLKRNL